MLRGSRGGSGLSGMGVASLLVLSHLVTASPALACDDGCDSSCKVCCGVWQVSAICGTRALVDSSFARHGIAERVARSLNEQAASCDPNTGSCEGARIECPGTSTLATWKATCERDARNETPALTHAARGALVQADRFRRAAGTAIPSAQAWLEALRDRPDAKREARTKAGDLQKELEKARAALSANDEALAAALATAPSEADSAKLMKKLGPAIEKVADRLARAEALVRGDSAVDPGAGAKQERAEREARERAEKKARDEEARKAAQAAEAERAERKRAEQQAKLDRRNEEKAARAAREAQEKAARAEQAAAREAERAGAAARAAAEQNEKTAAEATEARTDALTVVARASSRADQTLLAAVKLGATGSLGPSDGDQLKDTRQKLEKYKTRLGELFSELKASESEPDAKKRREAARTAGKHAAELLDVIEHEAQRVKALAQKHGGGGP